MNKNEIIRAQIRAGEDAVIAKLKNMGLIDDELDRGLPEYVTTGFSRAEWHNKAWSLYQAKRFSNTQLSAVSIHTIRTVFDATFDALMEVTDKGNK